MAQTGFTPIITYHSTTGAAVPDAANLAPGEMALNIADMKLYAENSSGVVTLLASSSGASGDVVGPASATDNAVVRFDGTTGKLVQNSVVTIADSTGDISGVGTLNATTADLTNLEVTNIKAKDGTAAGSIADSTGVVSITANPILSGGTANGVAYLNGSKVLTTGSALTFDGTNLSTSGSLISSVAPASGSLKRDVTNSYLSVTGGTSPNSNGATILLSGSTYVAANTAFVDAAESVFRSLNGASEYMRLTSTGLGIGTSSPISKITALGAGTINAPETSTTGGSIQTASYGITTRTGNLDLGATDALAANIGGSLTFSARYSGSNASWVTGKIGAYRDTATSGVASSYLAFATTTGAGDLTERLRIDASGNLGLGVTPSAWLAGSQAIQNSSGALWQYGGGNVYLGQNYYLNGSVQRIYSTTAGATEYNQAGGAHRWYTAPSGTAGNAITFTQAMTLDASGRLGIGETSPSQQVHAKTASTTYYLAETTGTGTSAGFRLKGGASADYTLFTSQGVNQFAIYDNAAGSERMRIDSSGNLGLGVTPNPATFKTFAIGSGSNVGSLVEDVGYNDLGIGSNVYFDSTWKYVKAGECASLFRMYGYGGTFLWQRAGAAANAGDTISWTTPMTLDSSGNLLIGYTSSNGSYKLQVNSQIFATNATIATSDGRYKENIQSLDGALDLVTQLNPVQFSWKEHPVHNFDRSGPTVGFIAQEVEQVLADKPYLNSIIKRNECVIEPEEKDSEGNITKEAVTEEFLGIAEGNMIAILTKALQELKAEFDFYKASHP